MIETALKHEIIQAIPELNNKIYPTNAPEGAEGPYLVYTRITTNMIKTLEGYTDKQAVSYMFSIMAKKYRVMTDTRKRVKDLLLSLPKTHIGSDSSIYIEDINIDKINEQYEHELNINRGIIDFTIYF